MWSGDVIGITYDYQQAHATLAGVKNNRYASDSEKQLSIMCKESCVTAQNPRIQKCFYDFNGAGRYICLLVPLRDKHIWCTATFLVKCMILIRTDEVPKADRAVP